MDDRDFPISAGILLGLGLGGFFDGIILHQVLQWHHMLTSAGFAAPSRRDVLRIYIPQFSVRLSPYTCRVLTV